MSNDHTALCLPSTGVLWKVGLFLLASAFYGWSQCPGCVLVSEYNIHRTGADTQETTLTPANVLPPSTQFGRLSWAYPVDNCVYAHPLYVYNTIVNNSPVPHNVVFLLTTNA